MEAITLKNNFIAKTIQRKIVDFHFSWRIFSTAWHDTSEYVIVGGSYWIPNAVATMVIHHLKKKKVAYFSEPLFVTGNKLKYASKWVMLRILNSCCDALFCIGRQAAVSFTRYGVTIPKFIIPYNIDEQQFANLDSEYLHQFKQRYNPDNKPVVLSSGALVVRKGMDILIQAVRQVPLCDMRLIIIGDGQTRNAGTACSRR